MANSSYAGITFWTTEVQPARMEKQQEMAKQLKKPDTITKNICQAH